GFAPQSVLGRGRAYSPDGGFVEHQSALTVGKCRRSRHFRMYVQGEGAFPAWPWAYFAQRQSKFPFYSIRGDLPWPRSSLLLPAREAWVKPLPAPHWAPDSPCEGIKPSLSTSISACVTWISSWAASAGWCTTSSTSSTATRRCTRR